MKALKYISAAEAVRAVRSGDHVHLSSIASVPHILIEALCARVGELRDVHFHHFHTEGPAPYGSAALRESFRDQGFFVGPNLRASVQAGVADYIPTNLFESQLMYRTGALRCDVAMVQVSEPVDGMVSLGTSVDCSIAALEVARERIAVVNPQVPFAYGDLIPLERFTALVQDDRPLVTSTYAQPSATDLSIGRNCAELIPDGACLQMGIGAMPNAICACLGGHRHLGLHTEMFSDGALQLIRSGVIDGACKTIDTGKVVASFLLGSQEVYDFIRENPQVLMRDIAYTNDPRVIAQNPGMVSINSAIEIDLTGQVCADSIGSRIYSGTGGQLDFVRGAKLSKGGKAIIALASRTRDGLPKIVPQLQPGAGVVTPRADVQWVVTEYGAANLYGKSLQERARLLISIAHPQDREALSRAAYERFGR
ncbi:MAG: acetyl-CoA hydrolase/transferase C-terminal domain-containing protein [Candidatus Cryptobacteroides sp.]|nr:acetyl-CoA hydrolase/transferase C-terminal domain-containing protein [Candidatus Cryptobacteroides sp.]